MNQPPQGGPGHPPPNQGPYQSPQQPAGQGGYNSPSQGQYASAPPYPQPPQYAAPYPQFPPGRKPGPGKGLGILKLLIGLCLGLSFLGALLHSGHEGIAESAIMGTMMGLGLRWMFTGGANLAGKKIPLLPSLGVIAVGTVIGALAGPPVSEMQWKSQEESRWDDLMAYIGPEDHVSRWEWEREYFNYIPPKYHREAAPGMRKYVEVRDAIQNNDLTALRRHVYDLAINHKGDEHYKLAFDTASGELQQRYDKVLAELSKPGAEGEFAVDEELRAAFKTILTDLARAPTSEVHVAFANRTSLDAPPGHEQGLADEAALARQSGLSVMNPPKVIHDGDAFSSIYDNARRNSFMQVSGAAFNKAFDANLLTLKALEGESREGKFVIEVSSHIRRTPSYYRYTQTRNGVTKLAGFLFAIVVDWEMKLYDRKGELMYERQITSIPGDNLSLSNQPTDPDWAPYSILMDSAYYNYSREVVGNFGLTPPEVKTVFAYSNYGVTGK